jgi:hypothetical protein
VTKARPIKWSDEVKRIKVVNKSDTIKISIIEHSLNVDLSEEIGSVTLPFSALIFNSGVDEWFEALNEKGRSAG